MFPVRKALLVAAALMAEGMAMAAPQAEVATIQADLRDAARGVFHATMRLPVEPGPIILVYPRWIPGDHLPAGPIENLAGLHFSIAGKPVAWARDRFDVDAFHLTIPPGARALDVRLDFLAEPTLATAINQASNATTDNLAVLRWHVVTLYPQDAAALTYRIRPSVLLPKGWTFATAMAGKADGGGTVDFPETTLERLIDSPLIAGRYTASYPITTVHGAPVTADFVVDEPASLAFSAEQARHLGNSVQQAYALFGSEQFEHYRFLITLSDTIRKTPTIGGQEHFESSDDIGGLRTFLDPAGRETVGNTLAHEFAHVWNGKYRRPIGETTLNYQQANDNGLLWVYEGLTTYLGGVLAARGGAWTADEFRDALANAAAAMAHRGGRRWRSLMDTGVGLGAIMHARTGWQDWRRSADYYTEGQLLWLDVDLTIRRSSGDTRSLDDFCRIFFAKSAGDPKIKPYDMDEIVSTLQKVAPNDWRSFLRDRLEGIDTHLPEDVFRQSGWALGYKATPNPFAAVSEADGALDATYSLGLRVDGDGKLASVEHGSPADDARLSPGETIVALNGERYKPARLRAALDAAQVSPAPIRLTISGNSAVRDVSIVYRGGQKYPTLLRNPAVPDRLAGIVRPIAIAP